MEKLDIRQAVQEVKDLIGKQMDLYEANAPQKEQDALEEEVIAKKLLIANHVIWYGMENKEDQRKNGYAVVVETVDKTQPQTDIYDLVFWCSDKEVNIGDHIFVEGAPHYTGEAIVVAKTTYTTVFDGEFSCTFKGYPIEEKMEKHTILTVSVKGRDDKFLCEWKDYPQRTYPAGMSVALRHGSFDYEEAYVLDREEKYLTREVYRAMYDNGLRKAYNVERLICLKYGFDPNDNLARY